MKAGGDIDFKKLAKQLAPGYKPKAMEKALAEVYDKYDDNVDKVEFDQTFVDTLVAADSKLNDDQNFLKTLKAVLAGEIYGARLTEFLTRAHDSAAEKKKADAKTDMIPENANLVAARRFCETGEETKKLACGNFLAKASKELLAGKSYTTEAGDVISTWADLNSRLQYIMSQSSDRRSGSGSGTKPDGVYIRVGAGIGTDLNGVGFQNSNATPTGGVSGSGRCSGGSVTCGASSEPNGVDEYPIAEPGALLAAVPDNSGNGSAHVTFHQILKINPYYRKNIEEGMHIGIGAVVAPYIGLGDKRLLGFRTRFMLSGALDLVGGYTFANGRDLQLHLNPITVSRVFGKIPVGSEVGQQDPGFMFGVGAAVSYDVYCNSGVCVGAEVGHEWQPAILNQQDIDGKNYRAVGTNGRWVGNVYVQF